MASVTRPGISDIRPAGRDHRRSLRAVLRGISSIVAAGAVAFASAGCSLDGLLKSDQIPPGVTDPAITQTPEGALAAYHGTVAKFRAAFGAPGGLVPEATFVSMTGLFSDELQTTRATPPPEELRSLPEGDDAIDASAVYRDLNLVRSHAAQALGLLGRYVPEDPALRGHIYALQGYVEVFLAELFCSGIPLSTLDFDGDYTYRPGSTTQEVLTHAAALFDTALSLAADSVRFAHLARVGQARALLGRGEYAAAAAMVASVPDDYRYAVSFTAAAGANASNFFSFNAADSWEFTVADREGFNGLDFRTSGDPRTSVTPRGTYELPSGSSPIYYPDKYTSDGTSTGATDGSSAIVLASGVEARLIEAEWLLQANPDDGQWLSKLNALRTDGTYDLTATSPPDTLWHAGTGGVAGLAPLADPGTSTGRVDLLFRERAFWLFLTGHRQGDLRRLIRQYGRTQDQIYPTGRHPSGYLYGSDVNAPIPPEEQTLNPYFTGCASRGA